MSYQINKITPFQKWPCAKHHADSRGLTEHMETVFILQGFTDGHMPSPLKMGERYFRPFTRHDDPDTRGPVVDITVLLEDAKNPFKGGDVSKYQGATVVWEKIARVKRVKLSKPTVINGKTQLFAEKELLLEQIIGNGSQTHEVKLSGVLAWKSGQDSGMASAMPFSVKAIELTTKEIEGLKFSTAYNHGTNKHYVRQISRPQKVNL